MGEKFNRESDQKDIGDGTNSFTLAESGSSATEKLKTDKDGNTEMDGVSKEGRQRMEYPRIDG